MAEFVEFRAEEWIEELEQMERIRLFERKEIKSIASKRREFEYKIQRRTKCKEDFLKYIQFEIDLHRIIKARRKKNGIKGKRGEIDHSQANRIANLFKKVIFRFQSDIKLWMSFFKFCEDVRFHSLVSCMLVRMLQIHASKAELWVFAAKWEFEKGKSINNARQILTRGLRHHPSNSMLYEDLFRIELEYIKQRERKIEKQKEENENFELDEVTKNVISGKVAEVIYEVAIKTFQNVDFKVSLLLIANLKKAPKNLRNKIFRDIVKMHLNEELTWDTIAKREFEGLQCNLNQLIAEEVFTETDEEKGKENISLRDKIQNAINVYEESINKLNSIKMWSFYLDFVLNLNKDVDSLPVYKSKLLNNAMEGALASGYLTEKYYLEWIDILQKAGGKNDKLLKVLQKGTEQHPKSLRLWYMYLKYYLSCDQEQVGIKVFNEATENLTDAVPIWNLFVKFLQLKSSPKIEKVIQRGIKQGGEVARTLKPIYIEWLAQAKGMAEARKIFDSLEMNIPPCLELYKKMAALEAGQAQPCIENVRRCHELACRNFGGDNADVWLDYVRFELKKGDISKVTLIHRRALKALLPEQADTFVATFNNFKMDIIT